MRDASGRFLPGNNGGPGRQTGSENHFSKVKRDLLRAYETTVEENELAGESFWRNIKKRRPALFARLVVSLLPREVFVEGAGRQMVIVKFKRLDPDADNKEKGNPPVDERKSASHTECGAKVD
jgi:hypothetical protein